MENANSKPLMLTPHEAFLRGIKISYHNETVIQCVRTAKRNNQHQLASDIRKENPQIFKVKSQMVEIYHEYSENIH